MLFTSAAENYMTEAVVVWIGGLGGRLCLCSWCLAPARSAGLQVQTQVIYSTEHIVTTLCIVNAYAWSQYVLSSVRAWFNDSMVKHGACMVRAWSVHGPVTARCWSGDSTVLVR